MGLLNLATKIKNYKKGFYIHYKFEGDKRPWRLLKKNKSDGKIIRYLTVKYKKLDMKKEFFGKENNEKKEQKISKKKQVH